MRLSAFVAGLGWVSAFATVWCVFLGVGNIAVAVSVLIFSLSIALLASIIVAKKEPTGYSVDVSQLSKMRGRSE